MGWSHENVTDVMSLAPDLACHPIKIPFNLILMLVAKYPSEWS